MEGDPPVCALLLIHSLSSPGPPAAMLAEFFSARLANGRVWASWQLDSLRITLGAW